MRRLPNHKRLCQNAGHAFEWQGMGPTETDKHPIQLEVEHRQLALLYAAIPSSLLATLFGCLVAILIYQQVISLYRLYSWVGLMLGVSLFRHLQYRQYLRAAPSAEERDRWFVRFRIGALLQAFAVGSAGLLLFSFDDGSYQMLLALMIVSIGAFATTTLAPHRPIVVAFLLIALSPIVLMVFFLQTEVTRYISLILVLLTLMLIFSALRIHKTISDATRLGIEARYREERLRDFRQRLSMFVEATPLAVIEWKLDRSIIEWNPAAEHIFGHERAAAASLAPADLMYNRDNTGMDDMWRQVLDEYGPSHAVLENRRRDGALILCKWINTPLIDAQEQVVGVISLVEDVTQRIANERLKNEFVSIVSHELRTPVTSIKGGLGLLVSGVLDDDKAASHELLEVALLNTNRLQMLINDILDVDKLESGKMEYHFRDCDLGNLIDEVIAANGAYALQYGVTVQRGELPAVCRVNIDPDRIFQVLTNLLSNAVKFSVRDGTVAISVQIRSRSCLVAVTNRGEVIPAADRERMFTKFFQRDSSTTRTKGGTGLGLYICQKILREHGSTLDFSSSESEGTTFYFELSLN
jgi:PAS domain S-box-containing protein